MTDRELLELIAEKVNGLDQSVNGLNRRFDGLEQKVDGLDRKVGGLESKQDIMMEQIAGLSESQAETSGRLERIEGAVVRIENEHGGKINALFDAREVLHDQIQRILESQNRMEIKLDRMTLKVSAHDVELKKAK